MCMLPVPSSLYRLRSISCGSHPPALEPVESCKYLPTTPLLFASPAGCFDDLELRSSLADSHALAPNITCLANTWYSCISSLLIYDTPVARPLASVSTSRTIALAITFRLPVFIAGITRHEDDEKSP